MPRKPLKVQTTKIGKDFRIDFIDNFGQRLRALFNVNGRTYQRRTYSDGSTFGDDIPAPQFRLPRNTARERGYPTRYTTRRPRK